MPPNPATLLQTHAATQPRAWPAGLRLAGPRFAGLLGLSLLAGCSTVDDVTSFFGGSRDPAEQVDSTSYTANRLLGRESTTEPLTFGTPSGDIDAVIASEPNPDIRQRIQQEVDDFSRSPQRRGSSTPPSLTAPPQASGFPPPPAPRPAPPAEPPARSTTGQVLTPPSGPPAVLQGTGPIVPYVSPGGVGGTAVTQGGFITLYGTDGSVRTVPAR